MQDRRIVVRPDCHVDHPQAHHARGPHRHAAVRAVGRLANGWQASGSPDGDCIRVRRLAGIHRAER